MVKTPVVYISGPLTQGNETFNLRRAILAGDQIADMGFVPLIPHLSLFWNMVRPHEYTFWLKMDLVLIGRCDAVFRLSGYSPGAEEEVKEANKLGIPVFYDMQELKTYLHQRDNPA